MRANSRLLASLMTLIAGARQGPDKSIVMIDGEAQFASHDVLLEEPRNATAFVFVVETLPEQAQPFSLSRSGQDVRLSMAGLEPHEMTPDGIEALIEALEHVADIIPVEERSASASSYAFGRDGRMNAGERLATIWARSTVEALAKFHAVLDPAFGKTPSAAVGRDIHGAGEITMRRSHDWRPMNIGELETRFQAHLAKWIESDANPENDGFYGF